MKHLLMVSCPVRHNKLYIFDLDGTIAHTGHRQHYLDDNIPPDWDGFFAACVDDTPIFSVIELMRDLRETGARIEIWSGRSDAVRPQTVKWLDDKNVPYDRLLMREHGDYTADEVLKMSWLGALTDPPDAVFDDRDKVVKMWRDQGLLCCQVAYGSF